MLNDVTVLLITEGLETRPGDHGSRPWQRNAKLKPQESCTLTSWTPSTWKVSTTDHLHGSMLTVLKSSFCADVELCRPVLVVPCLAAASPPPLEMEKKVGAAPPTTPSPPVRTVAQVPARNRRPLCLTRSCDHPCNIRLREHVSVSIY